MCIGDQDNDLAMLQYAGLGVAMGNALKRSKKWRNLLHYLIKNTVLQSLSINLFKHDIFVFYH